MRLNPFTLFYLALILSFSAKSNISEPIVKIGQLTKIHNHYYIEDENNLLTKISINPIIRDKMASLTSDLYNVNYQFKFELEKSIYSPTRVVNKIPTLVGGSQTIFGTLTKTPEGFYIHNIKVIFEKTKVVGGHAFDEASINYFLNKRVIAEVNHYGKNRPAIIQSINLLDYFIPSNTYDPIGYNLNNKNFTKKIKFLLNEMNSNEISKSTSGLKTVIYKDKKNPVTASDQILILTLSGRQGGAPGGAAGHYAAGMGKIENGLIRGEIFNAYVNNSKDILSSHISLESYFSHLVQGQNVYRPTYTLLLYGIDKNKLNSIRNDVDVFHSKLRTSFNTITPQLNCTTVTNTALKKVNFFGATHEPKNSLKHSWKLIPLSLHAIFGGIKEVPKEVKTLNYLFRKHPEFYIPRPSFNNYLRAIKTKRTLKKWGVKKVEYIFMPQIPSSRPIGGTAYNEIIEAAQAIKLHKDKSKFNEIQLNNMLDKIID